MRFKAHLDACRCQWVTKWSFLGLPRTIILYNKVAWQKRMSQLRNLRVKSCLAKRNISFYSWIKPKPRKFCGQEGRVSDCKSEFSWYYLLKVFFVHPKEPPRNDRKKDYIAISLIHCILQLRQHNPSATHLEIFLAAVLKSFWAIPSNLPP